MPFTVRVVLHEASEAAYTSLHAQMKACGFTRFIQNLHGQWLRLPPAEYRYERSADIGAVTSAARVAAVQAGALKSLLVTENVGPQNVMFLDLELAGPFEILLG